MLGTVGYGQMIVKSSTDVDLMTVNNNGDVVIGTSGQPGALTHMGDATVMGNVGIGRNPASADTLLSVGNGVFLGMGNGIIASGPDIHLSGSGIVSADHDMYFFIDSDGDNDANGFVWSHDQSIVDGSQERLMTLFENGRLAIEGRLQVKDLPVTTSSPQIVVSNADGYTSHMAGSAAQNGYVLKWDSGQWGLAPDDGGSGGDNLGNHTMTQNFITSAYWMSSSSINNPGVDDRGLRLNDAINTLT